MTGVQTCALPIWPAVGEDLKLHNSYFVLQGGKVASEVHKYFLPNYNVFDEVRHFSRDLMQGPVAVNGVRIGMPICEDAWYPDVVEAQEESGAEFLLVPNGSPYFRNKYETRLNHMVSRVVESGLPLVYLNMVGGQDDQVFDGGSFALNPGGAIAVQLPVFDEVISHIDLTREEAGWRVVQGDFTQHPGDMEQDYRVMVEALRDYMRKTGFRQVLLGLSGGIDSAIVATIAVDALGAENVRCVMLPSEYTSQGSLDDAKAVAENLGCRYDFLPIGKTRDAVTETLAPLFEGTQPDLTEENIQSRIRGLLLMALSNKFGEMLLTTGNKSEVAVGYATIYGDMAGGYNPIKDMYKTRVFDACRWRNAHHRDWMMGPAGEVIPPRVIDKAPSAELRPDQKDEDSLPPYPILDSILKRYIEEGQSSREIIEAGYDAGIVREVIRKVDLNEYKRKQAAPGLKTTPLAFGIGRRIPIVQKYVS